MWLEDRIGTEDECMIGVGRNRTSEEENGWQKARGGGVVVDKREEEEERKRGRMRRFL